MVKKTIKKPAKKKAVKKQVVKKQDTKRRKPYLADKPNKQIGKPDKPEATVEITNIMPSPIEHWNGSIAPGKKGMVSPYEADLLRRKKQAE